MSMSSAERSRKWRLANPSREAENRRKYRLEHVVEIRNAHKRWRLANPSRDVEYNRKYYLKHTAELMEKSKKYCLEHRAERNKTRRLRILKLGKGYVTSKIRDTIGLKAHEIPLSLITLKRQQLKLSRLCKNKSQQK